jgi:NitT/TauT family transport system substrate-binding protein
MRRFLPIAAAAAALALVDAAVAAESVTFMLDWLPAGDKAAVYLGVHKGLFEAEGLKVTVRSGRGSSDVVTKLATGAADMGTGGLAALLQAKASDAVPVKAVMSLYTLQPDAIFTTENAGINSLKDLQGKTVATATFSSSNVVWPLVLKANNVDPESIKLLKVDPGALAPMLASGKVAATVNWVTVAPAFTGPLKEVGKSLKEVLWSDYGFDGYGLCVFASDKMLTQRGETVRKFLKAYRQATELAIADPVAAATALKAAVPEVDTDTATEQWKASIPLMVNDIARKDGAGAFERKLLEATWQWVADAQGMPRDKFNPETAVDREFLK